MREALALVYFGVPWEIAFDLDNDERCAMLVIFGELEGGKFDWSTVTWSERR